MCIYVLSYYILILCNFNLELNKTYSVSGYYNYRFGFLSYILTYNYIYIIYFVLNLLSSLIKVIEYYVLSSFSSSFNIKYYAWLDVFVWRLNSIGYNLVIDFSTDLVLFPFMLFKPLFVLIKDFIVSRFLHIEFFMWSAIFWMFFFVFIPFIITYKIIRGVFRFFKKIFKE